MKKMTLLFILIIPICFSGAAGQQSADYSKIDLMMIKGDFNRVVDTCRMILTNDTLNSEIYYKMGQAYQNFLPDDKSFDCFLTASRISPDNNLYKFMLAKGLYNKGKFNQARPLLESLCLTDSMNWEYTYYLTSIIMQEGKYDESIRHYNRFYILDSANYIILDKIGYALLKKRDFENAIDFYSRSLALNSKNVNAIKNLSYLYVSSQRIDTAIQLLSIGMEIDPTDMDLYARRGAIHFSINYNKRALNDYLKILGSGDTSALYLKRAGIGYSNNLQPEEAIVYLLKAYSIDSSDYEVCSYLGQNYSKLNDLNKSTYYHNRVIRLLAPVTQQLSKAHVLLAEDLKTKGLYKEAITSYLKGYELSPDVNLYMILANIYDENLNDIPNALRYYQLFLNNLKNARMPFPPDYVESVRKRLEYLKQKQ